MPAWVGPVEGDLILILGGPDVQWVGKADSWIDDPHIHSGGSKQTDPPTWKVPVGKGGRFLLVTYDGEWFDPEAWRWRPKWRTTPGIVDLMADGPEYRDVPAHARLRDARARAVEAGR